MEGEDFDIPWTDISGANPNSPTPPAEQPVTPVTPPPAEPVAPVVQPETPAAPAAPETPTPPVGEQPPAEPIEEPAAPTDKGRFRMEGPDAHFARLRLQQVPQAEAFKIAYGQSETPVTPTPPAAPTDELKAVTDELEAIAGTLDKAGEDESLYTPEIRKAQRREAELIARKTNLEVQQAQAAAAAEVQRQTEFKASEDQSMTAAQARFPALAQDGSELQKAFAAEWDKIAADPGNPLYTLPDLPEVLAAKHAALLGIAPAAKAPTPPPVPPPQRTMQPVPASIGNTAPPVQLNPAQEEAAFAQTLAKASDDEMGDILGKDLFGANKSAPSRGFGF